ncbi:uncharacterized protein [Magallana gigas]|uniref:uncharacterized protein n=1 Tax=Magallana gigas TaxID=29159 RepID=UPI0033407886
MTMGLIAEVLLLVTAVAISGTVQSQNSNDERQNRSGNELVFHLMKQLYDMKKQIETLQNRKTMKCESGTAGQHKAPPPRWPYIQNVKFKSPFEETPTVTYGLFLLDSLHNTNVRILTTVTAVTKTGFQVKLNPWGPTVLYGARISWMACGK